MSQVSCHLSPTPTAVAIDPPPANSSTMHRTQKHKHTQKDGKNPQILFADWVKITLYMCNKTFGFNNKLCSKVCKGSQGIKAIRLIII